LNPDLHVRLTLEAGISPSEDKTKVETAMANVLGGQVEKDVRENRAKLESNDLLSLTGVRNQLRDRHVRAAARRMLLLKMSGHRTTLMLNRQAAAVGVVALCGSPEESPLGPLYLTIQSKEIDKVIEWLTAYGEG
jgi:uncharacterized protein